MCSTITTYVCEHTHMQKVSCKHKRTGFFCFPSSKSKACLAIIRARSDRLCRICRDEQVRKGRKNDADRRNTATEPVNRGSFEDSELNREYAALPHFTLPQAPPPAVVRQPPTQPQQAPRMSSIKSTQRAQRSPAVSSRPQPISPARPHYLSSSRPLASPPPRGRPRVSPNIPPSVTTMHISEDRPVSPVEPGFMNPRSVSPDEFGRAPWHYK